MRTCQEIEGEQHRYNIKYVNVGSMRVGTKCSYVQSQPGWILGIPEHYPNKLKGQMNKILDKKTAFRKMCVLSSTHGHRICLLWVFYLLSRVLYLK